MARSAFACFAVVLFIVMMTEGWRSEAAMSCGQIVNAFTPCIPYSRNGGSVPHACCAGFQEVIDKSKANPDLQAACQCMKNFIETSVPRMKETLVDSIPGKCGFNLPWKFARSVDCSRVHW
ncbi:lipid transfer protein [Cinnamomum micranthum f. kanehirae]|uniref:Non-specific lipid-transfer protein n=1 Tax=Cinnamomum micranthum f. kanehirae TaxID=337451 RepID=A0A3S3MBE5_9MAGN|nr:lipid transfer protein [Cinnamomum micranthum f. kanehirae]